MATKIFVNLPVKDLDRSKDFFTKIGFTINPQFTNEKAACVVISEDIYAMILREEFFKTFIPNTNMTIERSKKINANAFTSNASLA
jgi:predicted lactoylglutathione lyase